MNKKSRELLKEFEDAATSWGWQQDQGVGKSVDNAEKDFVQAKNALTQHIEALENTIHKYKYGKSRAKAKKT